MIVPSLGVKVLIAMKPTDFRNYAEPRIMRSPGYRLRLYICNINMLITREWALQSA
jgi:hypothetical protein